MSSKLPVSSSQSFATVSVLVLSRALHQHKSIRSSMLGSVVLILCESLGLSLAVCFTSLWFSSLAVSTSSHARVCCRCSTICPGSPSLLLHLCARVFADTLGDHPIGIGFSKTSHDHLITCGSESNFPISSADVKIIVPDGTSAMSELFVLVRTNELFTMALHGSVSAHSSSWRMEVLSRALRGSVSVPLATWRVKAFATVHLVLVFLRDPSRVIHGLILFVLF